MPADVQKPCHLGDGAYVSFDGFQFWFAANHHLNRTVVVDVDGMIFLARYMAQHFPQVAAAMAEAMKDQKS